MGRKVVYLHIVSAQHCVLQKFMLILWNFVFTSGVWTSPIPQKWFFIAKTEPLCILNMTAYCLILCCVGVGWSSVWPEEQKKFQMQNNNRWPLSTWSQQWYGQQSSTSQSTTPGHCEQSEDPPVTTCSLTAHLPDYAALFDERHDLHGLMDVLKLRWEWNLRVWNRIVFLFPIFDPPDQQSVLLVQARAGRQPRKWFRLKWGNGTFAGPFVWAAHAI